MNVSPIVESLHALSGASRQRLRGDAQKLVRLTESHSPLDTFLRQSLGIVQNLYAAKACVFWIRDPSGSIQPMSRRGFHRAAFSKADRVALDRCAESHWQAQTPQVCPQKSNPLLRSLISPLRDHEKPIGALQIILAVPSVNGLQAQQPPVETPASEDRLFHKAAVATASILETAIARRLSVQQLTSAQVEAGLQSVQQQLANIQRTIRLTLERYLQSLNGASLNSFEENQNFVRQIQSLLDSYGLRVRCTECGHPAILRCAKNESVPNGVFVFDHYLPGGRTFHGGGKTLPEIRVVPKPPRRSSGS